MKKFGGFPDHTRHFYIISLRRYLWTAPGHRVRQTRNHHLFIRFQLNWTRWEYHLAIVQKASTTEPLSLRMNQNWGLWSAWVGLEKPIHLLVSMHFISYERQAITYIAAKRKIRTKTMARLLQNRQKLISDKHSFIYISKTCSFYRQRQKNGAEQTEICLNILMRTESLISCVGWQKAEGRRQSSHRTAKK